MLFNVRIKPGQATVQGGHPQAPSRKRGLCPRPGVVLTRPSVYSDPPHSRMRVTVAFRVETSVEFKFAEILFKFNTVPLRGGEPMRCQQGDSASVLLGVSEACSSRFARFVDTHIT